MTKSAASRHMGRVADNGCIVCKNIGNGWSPALVHHIRSGGTAGMGQKASDWLTYGLCPDHHQGDNGIHSIGTKKWQMIYGSEFELLAQCLEEIYGR